MGAKNQNISDQRIHRWSFEAVVSDNDKQTKAFAVPGMTLGTRKDGREAAENIEGSIRAEMEEGSITVRVRAVMHERISHELVVEYHRLSTQTGVYREVAERFAHRLKFANREIDFRSSEQILNEEVQNVMGSRVKKAPVVPTVPTYKEDVAPDTQPRMKLGIAAVNEILLAPAEGSSE